ncbi:MAG: hypothetical protein ACFB2W_00480 [Leptolyngbyaceae cyanobacterium]
MVYTQFNGVNTQRQVTKPDVYFAGQSINDQDGIAFLNAGSATRQTVLIDIGTPAADTDYVFNIGGQTLTVAYTTADGDPFNEVDPGTAISAEILQNRIASYLEKNQSTFEVTKTGGTQLTLTHPVYSLNTAVSVSGGGTGFAVNTNTAANQDSHIEYGVVVVDAGSDDDGKLGALPSATGQKVLGFCRRGQAHARYSYAESQALGVPQDGVRPGGTGTATRQGETVMRCEAAFTGSEDFVYFRHTADGALTKRGYLAPASGTGLDQLASASVSGPSVVLSDGVMIVPVVINKP